MDYDSLVKLAADIQYKKISINNLIKSKKLKKLGIDLSYKHREGEGDQLRKRIVKHLRKMIEDIEIGTPPEPVLSPLGQIPYSAHIHPNAMDIEYEDINARNAPMNNENNLRISRSRGRSRNRNIGVQPYARMGSMPPPMPNNNDEYKYSSPKVTGYYPRGEYTNFDGGGSRRKTRRRSRRK
jgi:hypothetical protein